MTTTLHPPHPNTTNAATRFVIAALLVAVAVVGFRLAISARETAPVPTRVAVEHPVADPTGLGAALAVPHAAISGDPLVADPTGLGAALAVPHAAIANDPLVADPTGLGAALAVTSGALDD